jgi:hypothetical protein
VERVAVEVLRRPDVGVARDRVDLENRVPLAVDLGIDAETEQMLVVVGLDESARTRHERRGVREH